MAVRGGVWPTETGSCSLHCPLLSVLKSSLSAWADIISHGSDGHERAETILSFIALMTDKWGLPPERSWDLQVSGLYCLPFSLQRLDVAETSLCWLPPSLYREGSRHLKAELPGIHAIPCKVDIQSCISKWEVFAPQFKCGTAQIWGPVLTAEQG